MTYRECWSHHLIKNQYYACFQSHLHLSSLYVCRQRRQYSAQNTQCPSVPPDKFYLDIYAFITSVFLHLTSLTETMRVCPDWMWCKRQKKMLPSMIVLNEKAKTETPKKCVLIKTNIYILSWYMRSVSHSHNSWFARIDFCLFSSVY